MEGLRSFCIENMQIVSVLYYILMFLISLISLIIIIIKLFPKLKCFCYIAKINEQYGIDLVFINIRSKIIILDKLLIFYSKQSAKYIFCRKNKEIKNFKNQTIVTDAKINIFLPLEESIINNQILKIKVKDIYGRNYNVKIKGAK